jgi:GAF domain-containing protein/anti-sigma regulatory factor (Ser/Thr protein kinase)
VNLAVVRGDDHNAPVAARREPQHREERPHARAVHEPDHRQVQHDSRRVSDGPLDVILPPRGGGEIELAPDRDNGGRVFHWMFTGFPRSRVFKLQWHHRRASGYPPNGMAGSAPRRFAGWRRYALALVFTGVAVVGTQLLAGEMFMTPLVGTVVLVSVFLGIGPAYVAIAVSWIGLLVYVEPTGSLTIEDGTVARRWAVSLAVALVLVWIGWSLQRLRRKEAERAVEAEQATATAMDFQELARSLAAAATPTEVAGSLVSHMPDLLGAGGASLGLIEDGELVIVDPGNAARAALPPGLRLPLSARAPIATAARTGEPAYANTRAEVERVYPDGARLVRYAASALAVPLRVSGRVVGAMGFPFAHQHAVDEGTIALAKVAAEAGGQALERARLHELEQAARVHAELQADRMRLLQDVAERLSAAATASEVADVIVQQTTSALAAEGVLVYELQERRGQLSLLAHTGYPQHVIEARTAVPLAASSPVTDAVESGEPLALRTRAQIDERFGDSEGAVEPGDESLYCFPLTARGRTLGAVQFVYRAPTVLDSGILAIAGTIFRQGAVALDRSLGYEQELVIRRRSERLQLLTASLSGALTPGDVATIFIDEVLGSIGADAAALSVVDDETGLMSPVAWKGLPDELVEERGVPLSADRPGAKALRRRRPAYYEDIEELAADFPRSRDRAAASRMRSFAYLPLWTAGSAIGLAVLGWREPNRLAPDDRPFLESVAAQCALALDRARRYEAERDIAETLQRSVLPETVPSMEGVRVAALYLAGSSAVNVGGDWFDTLTLGDGTLGFVVGDVVGKGVEAAATMAQLRNGMRALALDQRSPGETVTKLNLLLASYTDVPFATLAYVTLDPSTLDATVTSAGHPPPLVVSPGGRVRFLEGAGGLPLGADPASSYVEWRTRLEPAATVVLYTDGLVERPERSIDEGLDLLAQAAGRAPREPDAFVDAVVAEMLGPGARGDDVALLVILLDAIPLPPLALTLPARTDSLRTLRRELERWLEDASVPELDARDVVLASWEAGANAIEHAAAPPGSTFRLDAALTGDRVRVEVADNGRWKEPRFRENRGLGLRLIEALMASVDVERMDGGTRVVMERPVTREPARGHGTRWA